MWDLINTVFQWIIEGVNSILTIVTSIPTYVTKLSAYVNILPTPLVAVFGLVLARVVVISIKRLIL